MVIHNEMQKIVNDIFYEIIQRVSDEIERDIETKVRRRLRGLNMTARSAQKLRAAS